jgi:hypothetical protein
MVDWVPVSAGQLDLELARFAAYHFPVLTASGWIDSEARVIVTAWKQFTGFSLLGPLWVHKLPANPWLLNVGLEIGSGLGSGAQGDFG